MDITTPSLSRAVIAASCLLAFLAPQGLAAGPSAGDVDLGIGDDETYKRPNSWSKLVMPTVPTERLLIGDGTGSASRPGASIAWRNANQVEEVEVRVRNLGTSPGDGRVFVDVLDETGKILLHLEPPDDQKIVHLPAVDMGGREGKILRMKASWELNALIDSYDQTRTRYDVKATVETVGADKNPFDNSKVKSWNIPFRVDPGMLKVYNYIFKNHLPTPVTLRWVFEHTPYPAGWEIKGVPSAPDPFTLTGGQEIRGALTMLAPNKIEEGAFLEARLSLANAADGTVFEQHEWFQVYDTEPPQVSNYRVVLTDDHRVAIQALVADKGSGVLEATGVRTEFSVDGGRTWAAKAHNYKTGNFVRPTLFETVLGPFAPGTVVQTRFTALDTAGNATTVIPNDASGFEAPPNATQLIEQAYLFPRTQPNPIFDLDRLKELKVNLDKLKAANVDINAIDFTKPNALDIDPVRLRELGLDRDRLEDLRVDLARVRDLSLDMTQLKIFPLKRVPSPADSVLKATTLEVTVR
jgi:hypothetical protein